MCAVVLFLDGTAVAVSPSRQGRFSYSGQLQSLLHSTIEAPLQWSITVTVTQHHRSPVTMVNNSYGYTAP